MPLPVVLDVDPGRDDAVALALACGASGARGLDLQAVTTVAGNVTLEKTTRNALMMLALLSRPDIPVGAGAEGPLYRELVTAEHVHGQNGLEISRGLQMPAPASEVDPRDALTLMAEVIERSAEPITLLPTGPLTNIAALLEQRPDLGPKIRRIVMMGGSVGAGNTTPAAEFNVYVDPEAARLVFGSGLTITMVGLDVTRRAFAGEDHLRRLRSLGAVGEIVAALLVEPEWGPKAGEAQPVHDAVAVAAALEPGLLVTRPMRVEVECAGEHTTGETVCDVNGISGKPPNADVAMDLDSGRVMELLIESVGRIQGLTRPGSRPG